MPYTEDPGYEPALHRDLEPIEQRINELESQVRLLNAAVEGLDSALRALADQHI